jgi:hypothetical protein
MAKIESRLESSFICKSFFGNLTLEPGLNIDVDDRLWNNCKRNNPDVQVMLKRGALIEIGEDA